jgi:hypothetical protein
VRASDIAAMNALKAKIAFDLATGLSSPGSTLLLRSAATLVEGSVDVRNFKMDKT